ncbi:hypothetical protein D3C71_2115980 [compost metagenome]
MGHVGLVVGQPDHQPQRLAEVAAHGPDLIQHGGLLWMAIKVLDQCCAAEVPAGSGSNGVSLSVRLVMPRACRAVLKP